MKDVYPFIDVSSNGSIDGFIASADAVLSRSDANTKIIPGHGALANKADMQRFHDMLVKVRGKIQALIDQGKSEDEVVAAKPDGRVRRGVGPRVHDARELHAFLVSEPEEVTHSARQPADAARRIRASERSRPKIASAS